MSGKPRPPASADWLTPEDHRALARFIEQSVDRGFRLAIIEVRTFAEREQLLSDITPLIARGLVRVAIDKIKGDNLWRELLALCHETTPRCLALSGIENSSDERDWLRQLNVQRDLFVRDIKVPWLLFIHPTVRVRLMSTAPDFCDFVALWLRDERTESALDAQRQAERRLPIAAPSPLPAFSNSLFKQASAAIEMAKFDEAADLLTRFDLKTKSLEERLLRQILGASLEHQQGKLRAAENNLRAILAEIVNLPESSLRDALYEVGLHALGNVLENQGKYDEAESLLRQLQAISEKTGTADNTFYSMVLRSLAGVLTSKGKYDEAETLLRQSLAISEKSLGVNHPAHSAALHAMAGLFEIQYKLDDAESLLRRALAIEKTLDHNHLRYGVLLNTLAQVLQSQSKHGEAETLLRQTLTIKKNILGTEHPSYGTSLHSLAIVLQEQGKYSESESLLQQALAVKEKVLGKDHPSYGASLHGLANVLQSQGRYSEAESLLRRVLTIEEKALGLDHPAFAQTLANLAMTLVHSGQSEAAVPVATRALAIATKAHGPAHAEVGQTLATLAYVQASLQLPAAKDTAARALQVLTQSLGEKHPATQNTAALLLELSQG